MIRTLAWLALVVPACAADYVVIVSAATSADAPWRAVADSLAKKHGGEVMECKLSPLELRARLAGEHAPRWLAWVARPRELGPAQVAAMHRLARGLDADPYADCRWGIVTGGSAAVAAQVVAEDQPLEVREVGGGTSFASECVTSGRWFSEFKAGERWVKESGGKARQTAGDADSVPAIVRYLNEGKPDCFITSGHASEHDWQPGYGFRNGTFADSNGELTGRALDGSTHRVKSPNPKIYLAVGNCRLGNIPGSDSCMMLAWIGSAGARQAIGYTVNTWFGYAGWGVLDYFLEQPGRFTLTEAWLANHHALVWQLGQLDQSLLAKEVAPGTTIGNGEAAGLLHDRDVTAFYGDPKWTARMAPGPLRWTESLTETAPGQFTWKIVPQAGRETFAAVDSNGSTRGGRPLIALLPRRLAALELVEGERWQPVLADDFVLLPNPGTKNAPPAEIVIRFRAKL
jgi:zinc protease